MYGRQYLRSVVVCLWLCLGALHSSAIAQAQPYWVGGGVSVPSAPVGNSFQKGPGANDPWFHVRGERRVLDAANDAGYIQTTRKALQSGPAANAAIGRLLRAVPAVGTALTIADLLTELSVSRNPATGELVRNVPGCPPITEFQFAEPYFQPGSTVGAGGSSWLPPEYRINPSNPGACQARQGTAGGYMGAWQAYRPVPGAPLASPVSNPQPVTDDALGELARNAPGFGRALPDLDPSGSALPYSPPIRDPRPEVVTAEPTSSNGPQGARTSTVSYRPQPDGRWLREETVISQAPGAQPEITVTRGPAGTPPTPPGEEPTQCDKYPDSLGCIRPGVPDSEEVPRRDWTFELIAENIFPSVQGCPMPRTLTVFDKTATFSWVPACDLAVAVRPLIIALGALAASSVMVAMLRK